jgi:hypothetical protein
VPGEVRAAQVGLLQFDARTGKDHRAPAEGCHRAADVIAEAAVVTLPLGVSLLRRPGWRPGRVLPDERCQQGRDVVPVRRGRLSDLLHRVDAAHARPQMIAGQLIDGLAEPVDELSLPGDPDLPQGHHGAQPDATQRDHGSQPLKQCRPDIVDRLEPVTRRERRPAAGSKIVPDDPGGREYRACNQQQDSCQGHSHGHDDGESFHTRSMTAPPGQGNP